MAKLFKIDVSNPFQSSPSSAILVPFCFRINTLVFFFLSKPLFLIFPTHERQFRPSKKWLKILRRSSFKRTMTRLHRNPVKKRSILWHSLIKTSRNLADNLILNRRNRRTLWSLPALPLDSVLWTNKLNLKQLICQRWQELTKDTDCIQKSLLFYIYMVKILFT